MSVYEAGSVQPYKELHTLNDLQQKEGYSLQGRTEELEKLQHAVITIASEIDEYIQQAAHREINPLFPDWANAMPNYGDHRITPSSSIGSLLRIHENQN